MFPIFLSQELFYTVPGALTTSIDSRRAFAVLDGAGLIHGASRKMSWDDRVMQLLGDKMTDALHSAWGISLDPQDEHAPFFLTPIRDEDGSNHFKALLVNVMRGGTPLNCAHLFTPHSHTSMQHAIHDPPQLIQAMEDNMQAKMCRLHTYTASEFIVLTGHPQFYFETQILNTLFDQSAGSMWDPPSTPIWRNPQPSPPELDELIEKMQQTLPYSYLLDTTRDVCPTSKPGVRL